MQSTSFLVSHPTDPKPRPKFSQCRRQAIEVLSGTVRNAVDVAGRPRRTVGASPEPADQRVLDPVAVKRLEDAARRKLDVSYHVRQPLVQRFSSR